MALHIVLVEPEIPPNTGNIARTCAASDAVLHLVGPLGFSLSDRMVKRAGLDYWPCVQLEVHDDLEAFLAAWGNRRMFLATTHAVQRYTDVEYRDGDAIVFGKETQGLPKEFIHTKQAQTIRIPMSERTSRRSVNLSTAAGIVLYEALRQIGFPDLK